mgnify:CR=1 FL=1
MKNTTQNTTDNKVTKKVDLHNLLGVQKTQNTQVDKKLSEKAQIMKNVNDEMHKLLCTQYPKYYKHIETQIVQTDKDGNHSIKDVKGYFLLFPKSVELKTKEGKKAKYDGFQICKPTLYVKGGSSYECIDFTEIGKTTFNN